MLRSGGLWPAAFLLFWFSVWFRFVRHGGSVLWRIRDLFQIAQRLKAMAFVLANPTLVDLMQRHWIEIMQLLAPAPHDSDEVCFLQQYQVFGHRLPRHVEVFA